MLSLSTKLRVKRIIGHGAHPSDATVRVAAQRGATPPDSPHRTLLMDSSAAAAHSWSPERCSNDMDCHPADSVRRLTDGTLELSRGKVRARVSPWFRSRSARTERATSVPGTAAGVWSRAAYSFLPTRNLALRSTARPSRFEGLRFEDAENDREAENKRKPGSRP